MIWPCQQELPIDRAVPATQDKLFFSALRSYHERNVFCIGWKIYSECGILSRCCPRSCEGRQYLFDWTDGNVDIEGGSGIRDPGSGIRDLDGDRSTFEVHGAGNEKTLCPRNFERELREFLVE